MTESESERTSVCKETSNANISHEDKDKKKFISPTKVFSVRESVLTNLMEISHVQTVYNISVAVCILLILNAIGYYIVAPQKFTEDTQIMRWAVEKMHIFLALWLSLNLACYSVFFMMVIWIRSRNNKVMKYIFLGYFFAVCAGMFSFTPQVVLQHQLPLITAFSIMCEQTRMFMKIYSFVRENYPRISNYDFKKDGDKMNNISPTFSHFTYYMFAPVLIYRDSYPRTEKVRWSFVLTSLLKMFGCIFIAYCLFMRFIVDIFRNVGHKPFRPADIALIFAGCMVVGSMMMFLIFYTILHCWLNAFAEMLRFGDRLFYKDWWNSTTFLQYYRMWNAVVYDWLYTYVYIDVTKLGVERHIARLNVFIVSAVVHDYIICCALGYFFPALGIVYATVGVILIFVTNKKASSSWNTFMWVFLFSGWGVLTFLYAAEWYSRKNCVSFDDSYWPRSFSCLQIDYS